MTVSLASLPTETQLSRSMLDWKYRNWIGVLKNQGAHFVTAKDILAGQIRLDACNILIRHDADGCDLYMDIWPLLCVEASLGVRSSIYLLPANDPNSDRVQPWEELPGRWFEKSKRRLKIQPQVIKLQEEGFEFGYHVDVLGRLGQLSGEANPSAVFKRMHEDIQTLKDNGLDIQTMTAHGFALSDGTRVHYDHYAAEFDYTERFGKVQSQFHLYEAFHKAGGVKLSERIPPERLADLNCLWAPQIRSFDWLHAQADQSRLSAEVLTLTDAAQCWKHLGIAELAFILPKLAGCLVVLNIHPVNFSVTDDGVAFTSQKADCSDHGLLEALGWIGDSIPLPEAEPVYRHGPHLEAIKYSGAPEYLIDWTQLTPQYVCPELGHKEIKKLDEVILQLNQKLNCGGWFNKLINTPNEMILALIHEQWPKENRSEAKVLEVCGGLGPVAIGLTHLGFRPENMTVTDVNASFMTLAKAISHTLFEDKIKTAVVDVRDIQLPDTYDIIVIAGWEDMSLPYDIVVEQCTKVLSPNGILVMTFLEETRILSEGYSFSPDRLLQKKPYFTVTPDSLYFYMERSGLKPEIYVDYGYPVNRFPRHLMVGRRQPVLTSLHREFKSHFHALQQLLNVEAQPIDWSSFLNIPPLSGGRTLKDLSQSELTHVLSQAIRKMTFHPYMDWNLDVMVIHDWDESTALAALLAGQGNKCGAVANITHTLLNAFGIPCRILLCQGYSELLESSVSHLLTEVYLEGAWRILDNDVFQFSDWQFQNEAGEWLTRDQVLQAGLTHWMQVAPNPYTYPALSTDETWLRKNWTAWFNAISGEVSIYKPTPHVSE